MTTKGVLSRVTVQLPTDPPGGTSPEYLRHQAVMSLFADQAGARPLFRVLQTSAGAEQLLILASSAAVHTTSIGPGTWVRRVESKPYAPRLHEGQRLDFSIAVNATGVVTQPDGRKLRQDVWDIAFSGQPGPDVDRERVYAQWLARQLAGAADVVQTRMVSRALVRVRRRPRAEAISFVQTELAGSLVVRDAEALPSRVLDGVGRARAFGCGLLCLLAGGSLRRR